jgi:hypothetical protein
MKPKQEEARQPLMDLTAFGDELAQDFTDVRLEHGGGRLIVPRAPVDMSYIASEQYPDDCDDDNAYQVFRERGLLSRLIKFEWQEDRGTAWDLAIDSMLIGDHLYVSMAPDVDVDQQWDAFVAVEHPEADEILDALLFDLMWDNGESYSIEILSSLPTTITSDRLSKNTVRAGLHLYLEWDDTRNPGAWLAAAELMPSALKADDRLAEASKALLNADGDETRDQFIEAYADLVFRTD